MARQKMGWSRILCHRYPQIFGRNREKKLRLLFVKFVKQKGPQRFFMDHPWRPLQFSWQRSITGDELARWQSKQGSSLALCISVLMWLGRDSGWIFRKCTMDQYGNYICKWIVNVGIHRILVWKSRSDAGFSILRQFQANVLSSIIYLLKCVLCSK